MRWYEYERSEDALKQLFSCRNCKKGERFDSTATHRKEDTTALRRHERWDLTV